MRIDLRPEHENVRRGPGIGTRGVPIGAACAGALAIATVVVGTILNIHRQHQNADLEKHIDSKASQARVAEARAARALALWARIEHASRARNPAPLAHVLATIAEGLGDTISLSRLTISMPATSAAATSPDLAVAIDLEGTASSADQIARSVARLSGQPGLDRVRLVSAQEEQAAAGPVHRCTMSMVLAMSSLEIAPIGVTP